MTTHHFSPLSAADLLADVKRRKNALGAVAKAMSALADVPAESPDKEGVCAANLLSTCASHGITEQDAEDALHYVLSTHVNDSVKEVVSKVLGRVRQMRAAKQALPCPATETVVLAR